MNKQDFEREAQNLRLTKSLEFWHIKNIQITIRDFNSSLLIETNDMDEKDWNKRFKHFYSYEDLLKFLHDLPHANVYSSSYFSY